MANPEHLAKLKEGVAAWNDWRRANRAATWNDWKPAYPEIVPDLDKADIDEANLRGANLRKAGLDGANLRDAKLSGANLSRAKLRGARLVGTKLIGASLGGAHLKHADLTNANLSNANVTGANLVGANLTDSNLFHANLSRADLSKADFSGARLGGTVFGDNDLSKARGLEAAVHLRSSTIGVDTIYRSQGKIPLAFLRGAGVPENFIEYMGSLTGKALEFYSCFISYSTKDQEFADRLHADLQNKGVRCWFAPHDMQGGKKTHEQIDAAIRMHEKLLLIVSPNSMNSEWVKTEIRKARKRECTEKKRVLFPVRLVSFEAIRDWELFDADEGKDLAVEIREYYIPDFSNWKNHGSYAKEFEHLLRDLKTEGPKAA
jgi:uncharacterized protein YjbI with pentapeptide repeats